MKKFISLFLVVLSLISILSINTFAQDKISESAIVIEDVTKCGFTYIKLQRLINGTWTDYTTYCYYDQYSESTSKTFSKSISAPKGYTYRVICEHYAEKTKLLVFKDKETSYNATSSLAF